jgi:hypothetical protein
MLLDALEISLICTGIHVCFWEGMILGKLGEKMQHWIFKPVAMCLPCMASVWSILLTMNINLKLMLAVCGVNTIIASIIQFFEAAQFTSNDN